MTPLLPPGPQADRAARRREQRSWYGYDWANSGWMVLVGAVLLGPYLTSLADQQACGFVGTLARPCSAPVHFGPLHVATGSVAGYGVALATVLAALVVPAVGLLVDRTIRKRWVMATSAWAAAAAGVALSRVGPASWALAVGLSAVMAILLAVSLVATDAILVQISPPDERDRVSSHGWAAGYVGGLVVLLLSLFWLTAGPRAVPGDPTAMGPLRDVVLFGAMWWGCWTLVPLLGVRDRHLAALPPGVERSRKHVWRQAHRTFLDLRRYRQAALMLLAFVIYNDGVQSLFAATSVYATRGLGFAAADVVVALVIVQIVAFVGALALGRVAGRIGARPTILLTLAVWAVAPVWAALMPAGDRVQFFGLGALIGAVMGGTQALSRSLFSRLVPPARAAEFFGFYQAVERGTSWLGSFAFATVVALSGDYRLAVGVLSVFFLVGGAVLYRVQVEEGIAAATA